MLRRSRVVVLGLVAWAVGCGTAPRIDTSSDERAAASLKEVRQSLPADMRPAFDHAVKTVVFSRLGEKPVPEMAAGPEDFAARALEPLDGMTANEVLTEARRVVAERQEKGEASK
jgi:hypothetical protein